MSAAAKSGMVLTVKAAVFGFGVILESADEVAVHLCPSPRQCSAIVYGAATKHLERPVQLTQHVREGRRTVGVEIEVVVRRLLLEPRGNPQIRVDRTLDEGLAVTFEERSQLRRQQRNGAIRNQAMTVEAPRRGRMGRRQAADQRRARDQCPGAH